MECAQIERSEDQNALQDVWAHTKNDKVKDEAIKNTIGITPIEDKMRKDVRDGLAMFKGIRLLQ